MPISPNLKKNLLSLILAASIIGCTSLINKKDLSKDLNAKKVEVNTRIHVNPEKINKISFQDINDYDTFVRSTVDKYFASDVEEMYDFYNIKKDLPKYGFKSKEKAFICFDCEGAVYKEDVDSIYFYSTCSEEMFERYTKYFLEDKDDVKKELTNRIHHYIKHEAAHSFYYGLGKELGEEYLFKTRLDTISKLEDIQSRLVEEGVADYMAYNGKLTGNAKILSDKDFREMIENKNNIYLYELGFILVKPILDINFEKGVEELIKNPLTKEDLNDLPRYREKRIENILK
jgi:hypothetical protein